MAEYPVRATITDAGRAESALAYNSGFLINLSSFKVGTGAPIPVEAIGTISFLGQPTATKILTISSSEQTDIYEFYANGGSYEGENIGVELGTDLDGSITNLVFKINTLGTVSLEATADLVADEIDLEAVDLGYDGNLITFETDDSNITVPDTLLGGIGSDPLTTLIDLNTSVYEDGILSYCWVPKDPDMIDGPTALELVMLIPKCYPLGHLEDIWPDPAPEGETPGAPAYGKRPIEFDNDLNEVGLYLDTGVLFGVAFFPDIAKTMLDDIILRVQIEIENGESIFTFADPISPIENDIAISFLSLLCAAGSRMERETRLFEKISRIEEIAFPRSYTNYV